MLKLSKLSQISDIIPQDEFENLDHSMINHSIVSTFKSFDIRKITNYGNNNFFIRTESWNSIDEPYPEQVIEIFSHILGHQEELSKLVSYQPSNVNLK